MLLWTLLNVQEGQATNFMSQESHLPHILQNTSCYSLQQCSVTLAFYLFHISFLIVHINPCIRQRKKVETNWGKKKKSFHTVTKGIWNDHLTLMLGLSGLQRAGYNSLNFSFSDLGLTSASDFEIKKEQKKAQWNTELRTATTIHSWFFYNWMWSLIFIWMQSLTQLLNRFNSRNTVLSSFKKTSDY